jgi:hypothetical protein
MSKSTKRQQDGLQNALPPRRPLFRMAGARRTARHPRFPPLQALNSGRKTARSAVRAPIQPDGAHVQPSRAPERPVPAPGLPVPALGTPRPAPRVPAAAPGRPDRAPGHPDRAHVQPARASAQPDGAHESAVQKPRNPARFPGIRPDSRHASHRPGSASRMKLSLLTRRRCRRIRGCRTPCRCRAGA